MRVTFDHSVDVAENTKTFLFKHDRPIRYTAGQFIELSLPHDNSDKRGIKRWFTLSSSPTEETVAITTKYTPGTGSSFKESLFALKPGDSVMMSEPMGDFVLPIDKSVPLVFIAGGIGITPMRSMIKWLLDSEQHRTIHLIYAANRVEEVAFRDLFHDFGVPTDIFLSDPPKNWQEKIGRLDAEKILEIAPDVDGKLYYISGPEPMVEQLTKALADHGVDKRRVVGDYFPNYKAI